MTLTPIVDDTLPPISQPMRPDDLLQYFKPLEFGDDVLYCGNANAYQVLVIELERYMNECEACPAWAERMGERE